MNKKLKDEIEELIKELLVSHDECEEEDKTQETPEEYLKYIDSIRFIELITAVESKYNIEIENDDLSKDNQKDIDTFACMVGKYIKNKNN